MTFLQIIFFTISQASFISAASISAERSYAICWPLKHRTLSTRTPRIGHLTVWILAVLFSKLFLLIPEAAHAFFKSFYGLLFSADDQQGSKHWYLEKVSEKDYLL